MLSIVIPTLHQWDYYEKVINNIKGVYKWEYEIITIENKLVNEARNEWVEKAIWKYILIINDDIVIPPWCIEWMIDKLKEWYSVACPTYTKKDWPEVYYSNWPNIVGFCFMIKQDDKYRCFPIPEELQLWYWDNWIYERLDKELWMVDIPIHHRESKTLMSDELFEKNRVIVKQDKIEWLKLKKKYLF